MTEKDENIDETAESEEKSNLEFLDENIDSEKVVEGGFNPIPYRGFKAKIASVKKALAIDWYTGPAGPDGRPTYNAASTAKKKILVIETAKLPEMDKDENPIPGKFTDKTVKASFNYTPRVDKVTGQKDWVISKSPNGKMWKFMKNQGVTEVSKLVGTVVILDTEADKITADRFWLRIKT